MRDSPDGQRTVLDLPQLHSRPSFTMLETTLHQLMLGPSSWDVTVLHSIRRPIISEEGLASYLTRLVSSPLQWLSEEEREEIWETASKRISERAGRSAMSSFERIFTIPVPKSQPDKKKTFESTNGVIKPSQEGMSIRINIKEPALTGDELGNKTWLGAYILAKKLPLLLPKNCPRINSSANNGCNSLQSINGSANSHIDGNSKSDAGSDNHCYPQEVLSVLELGAGTGLTGLACAALYPETTTVHLTDLPYTIRNLTSNIDSNSPLFSWGQVTTGPLDWSLVPHFTANPSTAKGNKVSTNDDSTTTSPSTKKYDIILAADFLYSSTHPSLVANAIATHLYPPSSSATSSPRVLTCLPFRTMERDYHKLFRAAMSNHGLQILEQGEEDGVEDWYDWNAGGQLVVKCWWAVWGWEGQNEIEVKEEKAGAEETEGAEGRTRENRGGMGQDKGAKEIEMAGKEEEGGDKGLHSLAREEIEALLKWLPELLEIW